MTSDSRRLATALCCAALLCLLAVWSWPGERALTGLANVKEGRR